jgi:hypothetical protein
MKKNLFLLLALLLVYSCDEEKRNRQTEVFEIREIGELSTTEFVYSKVLKIDDKGEWYKLI